ncbi:2-phosphosulfolactate phosphatase [Actinoalloteichus spitiensis]|uniref:2-phosphosulfolactate phosphatase n=1 Tax=Actinoalloteichus spitiensis TaxID=252394 RepID=UPI00036A3849|nr:2-phosphosulfolactate phosphatase [Actinoalloteichus spitiensis]
MTLAAPGDGAFEQAGSDLRMDWGERGVANLAPTCGVLVVVDVLSFSTAVDVAIGRGASVLPLRWRDSRAAEAAARAGAVLADRRRGAGWSLSPESLTTLEDRTLLALPSPNGATLCSLAAEHPATVLVGCPRNAIAVAAAAAAARSGRPVGVIAAGERWPDDTVRPAVEDLLGTGAIVSALRLVEPSISVSVEAATAATAFEAYADTLGPVLAGSVSGRELRAAGFVADLELAGCLDVSRSVPVLRDGVLRGA